MGSATVGGLIKFYNLQDWYSTLTPEQQEKIKKAFASANQDPRMVDTGTWQSSSTAAGFLWPIGMNAISLKDYESADLVLTMAIKITDDAVSKHFSLSGLINLTYKMRNEDPRAIEKCKEYCIMDINLAADYIYAAKEDFFCDCVIFYVGHTLKDIGEFLEAQDRGISKKDYIIQSKKDYIIRVGHPFEEKLKVFEWDPGHIPSFTRLAILYEKEGKIQEAIDLCKKAVTLGLKDANHTLYETRIAKLEKKLEKQP